MLGSDVGVSLVEVDDGGSVGTVDYGRSDVGV